MEANKQKRNEKKIGRKLFPHDKFLQYFCVNTAAAAHKGTDFHNFFPCLIMEI